MVWDRMSVSSNH